LATAQAALATAQAAAGEYTSTSFCFRGNPAGATNPSTSDYSVGTDYAILERCGGNTYGNPSFCPSAAIQSTYTMTDVAKDWAAATVVSTLTIGGLEIATATSGNTKASLLAAIATAAQAAIDGAAAEPPTATAAEAAVGDTLLNHYWWDATGDDLVAYYKVAGERPATTVALALGTGSGTALQASPAVTQSAPGIAANVATRRALCVANGGTNSFNVAAATPTWTCTGLTATNKTGNAP
jgi:hypothetical protein